MTKWKKNGSIKKLGLTILTFYLLSSIMSASFILGGILKLMSKPSYQPIPSIKTIGGKLITLISNDTNVETKKVPLITYALIFLLLFNLANLVSHYIRTHRLITKIRKLQRENLKNTETSNEINILRSKRNLSFFGSIFCILYSAFIFSELAVNILEVKEVTNNNSLHIIILIGSVMYAIFPLLCFITFIFKEVIKCIFYKEIIENENGLPAKIYYDLSNFDYVNSIFSFFFDIIYWDEVLDSSHGRCLEPSDKIEKNGEKYNFNLLYFFPVEVMHHEKT